MAVRSQELRPGYRYVYRFQRLYQASEKMDAKELVREINYCYSEFDKIIDKNNIEK
jgi:hypothetical protein